MISRMFFWPFLVGAILSAFAAHSAEQEAIDGCIDRLRAVGGPDGQGGEVISSEFSEAATLVVLRDRGGTTWRCLAYSDGVVEELTIVSAADDGQGAMAGAAKNEPTKSTERVQFAPGTSGAVYNVSLGSGDAVDYLLGAREGQFLNVAVEADSPFLYFIIYVPGDDILYESSQAGNSYRGQLYLSGDHRVSVFYNGDVGTTGTARIVFGID